MNPQKLVVGTVQLGLNYGINNSTGKPEMAEAMNMLELAEAGGIGFLDTASSYGSSQDVIREYFRRHPGSRFSILSKFHSQKGSLADQVADTSSIGARLYCYSYHSFSDFRASLWKSDLLALKESGSIAKIGVSIYDNEEMRVAINDPLIDVIQLPFNLLDNWQRRGDLISSARSQGKEIHVRSVFLQGLFYKDPRTLDNKWSELGDHLRGIHELADSLGMSISALALGYALSFEEIDKVLIGVETVSQLRELLHVANSLESATREKISSITIENSDLIDPRTWR